MPFLKRVFSADFRRALGAEAAGEYREAAKAYALAGERAKVAEMHLLASERAGAYEARIVELRAAVRWADEDSDEARRVLARLARAMLVMVRAQGVISESDRVILREAARLFVRANDPAGEGECCELVGDELQAAEAYQRAGEVERLEAVLGREEKRRRLDAQRRESFEEYTRHLAAGERDRAQAALRECSELAPGGEYTRLLDALSAQRIADWRIALRRDERRTLYVGGFPLRLGRDASCHVALRDGGISRTHAEIEWRDGFILRDAGSRNGTLLGELPIAGDLPLAGASGGAGQLGLGDLCRIEFEVAAALLTLRVQRGLDRGLVIVASPQPIAIDDGELSFVAGVPWFVATGRSLYLNRVRVPGPVQLVRGDQVELGEPGEPARPRFTVEA